LRQLFGPGADRTLRRVVLGIGALVAVILGWLAYQERSDARWGIGKPAAQPIAFAHDLHAGTLGIACRYCHVGATESRAAGMPSVQTCLTCHSQIWRGTPELEPLHRAARAGETIRWTSVSRLAAHARFHHGAHAAAGIGCTTCHGDVTAMAETVKTESFSMDWCVSCHRDPPEQSGASLAPSAPAPLSPASSATAARGAPPPASHRDGRDLTDCSVCHH
jgi:hypothetical protein